MKARWIPFYFYATEETSKERTLSNLCSVYFIFLNLKNPQFKFLIQTHLHFGVLLKKWTLVMYSIGNIPNYNIKLLSNKIRSFLKKFFSEKNWSSWFTTPLDNMTHNLINHPTHTSYIIRSRIGEHFVYHIVTFKWTKTKFLWHF